MEFKTQQELYERISPALRAKKNELRREGYYYIQVEDIWNFLKETKWTQTKNLSLYDMVSDVMNTDVLKIDNYFKKNLKQYERSVILEKED
jgi:hypothetical protein